MTDSRYCQAGTTVVGQQTFFVNNLLHSVQGDLDTHCMTGSLIAVNPQTFFINNIPAILAQMDKAAPDIPGCLGMHPFAPTDPQQGSPDHFIYDGMAGGGMGSMGGMGGLGGLGSLSGLGSMLGMGGFPNIGEMVSIGNFGQIAQFGNISNVIQNFGSISNFGNLSSVIGNFSSFGNLSGIMGAMGGLGNIGNLTSMIGTVKNFIPSGGSSGNGVGADGFTGNSGQLILQNVKNGTPTSGMTAIGHDTGNIFTFSQYNTGSQYDNGFAPDYSKALDTGIVVDGVHIGIDQYFTGKPSQDYQTTHLVTT